MEIAEKSARGRRKTIIHADLRSWRPYFSLVWVPLAVTTYQRTMCGSFMIQTMTLQWLHIVSCKISSDLSRVNIRFFETQRYDQLWSYQLGSPNLSSASFQNSESICIMFLSHQYDVLRNEGWKSKTRVVRGYVDDVVQTDVLFWQSCLSCGVTCRAAAYGRIDARVHVCVTHKPAGIS